MGSSVTRAFVPRLTTVAFTLSGSAPVTAAVVGLLCALLATHY